MAINFPLTPVTNQVYTYNNKSWTYNGNVWIQNNVGGATISVSNTAPSTSQVGTLWWDSDTGDFSVYYNNTWAGLTSAGLTDGSVTTAKLADGSVTTAKIVDGSITSAKLTSTAVLPSQATNTGKFLTTDGANVSWSNVTPPAGSITSSMIAASSVTPAKLSLGTDSFVLSTGTTAQRVTTTIGSIRYNSTFGGIEVYNGTKWTLVSGGPSFNVYANAGQSLPATTQTQISLQNKLFDTMGCFNNTASSTTLNGLTVPAYSFMPPVEGYYQINFSVRQASSSTEIVAGVTKNGGSNAGLGTDILTGWSSAGGTLVYLNGTTDYIQLQCWVGGSVTVASRTATIGGVVHGIDTYFSGSFVRGV